MAYRDGFGQNFGQTGKAAFIPAAMSTISGVQAIQERQNQMAMQEMKMEEEKKKEEFLNEPMSIDYILAQSGFQPGTKAHKYIQEQFSSVAKDGWTTRGDVQRLQQYLKGSEQHTVGFLNAQIEDADSRFMELQDKVFKAKENSVENQDYSSQQKLKQMEEQLRSFDMSRKALRDKLYGTQEAFKQYAAYEREEMKKEQDRIRQREGKTSDYQMNEMRELIRQATKQFEAIEATKRKGIRPATKTELYEVVGPDGKHRRYVPVPEGVPLNVAEGERAFRISTEKKEEKGKGGSWKEKTGGPGNAAAATPQGRILWD